MHRNAITSHSAYTNGKTFRKVVGLGGKFVAYHGQRDTDCIGYLLYRINNGAAYTDGVVRRCTRTSFATWAQREATPAEAALFVS